jgi:tRNA (cytidine/uridine-2'-O-)-methyltransferase
VVRIVPPAVDRMNGTSMGTGHAFRPRPALPLQRTEKGQLAMFHIALLEPEIPPNTGNVARLCAATGASLHLIGRLGFRMDDRSLKRAGLDYWAAVEVCRHSTFEEFETAVGTVAPRGIWLIDNPAPTPYTRVAFRDGDVLLFGSESKGLPPGLKGKHPSRHLGIPMPGGAVRSLNLATAVGVVLYEALRQVHGW